MNKIGKDNTGTIVLIVLVLAGIYVFSGGNLSGLFASIGTGGGGGGGGVACADVDGKVDLMTVARNPNNATTDYPTETLSLVENGRVITTQANSYSTSGTQTTGSGVLVCGHSYDIRVIDNSNFVSITPVQLDSPVVNHQTRSLITPRSSEVQQEAMTSAYAEIGCEDGTASSTTFGGDRSVNDTAISSGGSNTWIVRVRNANASAQFGSSDTVNRPTYVCLDFDLSKYSYGSVTVTGDGILGVAPTLPTYCGNNGYEKAYHIEPILNDRAYYELRVNAKADLADPSTDVKLIWVDTVDTTAQDGSVIQSSVTSTGGDAGETNRYISLGVS